MAHQQPVAQLSDQLVGALPFPALLQPEDRAVAIGVDGAERVGDGGGGVEVKVGGREGGGERRAILVVGNRRAGQREPRQPYNSGGTDPPPTGRSNWKK
jgi:hypothetical protein